MRIFSNLDECSGNRIEDTRRSRSCLRIHDLWENLVEFGRTENGLGDPVNVRLISLAWLSDDVVVIRGQGVIWEGLRIF